MPMIFSVQPFEENTLLDYKFDKTASYKHNLFPKFFTAPIKSELKEKYLKEMG